MFIKQLIFPVGKLLEHTIIAFIVLTEERGFADATWIQHNLKFLALLRVFGTAQQATHAALATRILYELPAEAPVAQIAHIVYIDKVIQVILVRVVVQQRHAVRL